MDGDVDVVREGIERWNRGDVEGTLELTDEEIVWRNSGAFPDLPQELHGHEGVRRFWRLLREVWAEFWMDVERLEDFGDGRVLALVHFCGRGRDGIEVRQPFAQIYGVRDGLLITYQGYASWDEGLAAARAPRVETWQAESS